ncbi:hypothetical protein ACWCQQ_16170 [Streptomyces sp. NPDC002143]
MGARRLYEALRDGTADRDPAPVMAAWLARAEGAYRTELLAGAGVLAARTGPQDRRAELLWELYALSRVSDVLLLSRQPPPAPGEEDRLHHWPTVGPDAYATLFAGLGMTPFEESGAFDPFWHEIVAVEQAEDPDEPVRITGVVWPGLRLGPVLFGRAGVRVRAGVRHAERGVADRSPLYWTFLRRHRPTVDESLGWGHNSQWRTDFRVDVRTAEGDLLNAEGRDDAHSVRDDPHTALLTPAERMDLLRHRCLLRTPARVAELDAVSPDWATDLYPFDWRAKR